MSFARIRYWLLLLLSLPFVSVAGTYELRPQVFVTGAQYSLLELMDVSSLSEADQKKLAVITAGVSPRPGQSVWVTQRDVMRRLRQAWGAEAQSIRIEGSGKTRVISVGVERSIQQALEGAKSVMDAWLAQRYGQYASHLVSSANGIVTYSGSVEFRPHMPENARLSKRMRVMLDVVVDGAHFTTVPLWFEVTVTEPAWILEEPAKAHESVNMAILRRENIDVAGLQGRPFRGDLSNLRFVRARSEGVVLKVQDLEPVPAVAAGEQIKVVVTQGVVTLVANAKALTDGQLRERIRVKSLSSGESYLARVTGRAQARVE